MMDKSNSQKEKKTLYNTVFYAKFVQLKLEKAFQFIGYYPDFATFIIIVVSSTLQILVGNSISVLIFAVSVILFSLMVILPTNLLMKNPFKIRRPEQYYRSKRKSGVFEGSFPSFHSQFSAGEATTYIVVIALYSPEEIRLAATLLAIFTVGFASMIVAWSRVALGLHYPVDAVRGIILGVVTGFVTSYTVAPLLWDLPQMWKIAVSAVFSLCLCMLFRKDKGAKSSYVSMY
jgi:membrane-associated phospholipid phosphatase